MKRFLSLLVSFLVLIPAFSATVSVLRLKPAEYDIGSAKTIAFTKDYKPSEYLEDESSLAEIFIQEYQTYLPEDGRLTLVADPKKADLIVNIKFTEFKVSDMGEYAVAPSGEVIQDDWKRSVAMKAVISAIRNSDSVVICSKELMFMDNDMDPVPRAQLKRPTDYFAKDLKDNTYSCAIQILNTPYAVPLTIQDTKIKENKDGFKAALKLAKSKNYEEAKAAYKEIYDSTQDPAAYFNYARMCQATNNYDEANAIVSEMFAADAKNKDAKKAIESISKDRKDYEILQSRITK